MENIRFGGGAIESAAILTDEANASKPKTNGSIFSEVHPAPSQMTFCTFPITKPVYKARQIRAVADRTMALFVEFNLCIEQIPYVR
ncbi:MAG: hypothetical protein AAF889_09030 [Cyanobacteria bacterium P01_D01_bin.73]